MANATTPSRADAETLPHQNTTTIISATAVEDVLAEKPETNDLSAAQVPPSLPDEGRAAWSAVAGGWCCMFVNLGWINSIGVFQTIYEHDQLRTSLPV